MKLFAIVVVFLALLGAGCEFETHENRVASCSATNSGWELKLDVWRDSDTTPGDVVPAQYSEICDLMQDALDGLPVDE